MKILEANFKVRNSRQRQFRDKTAYVGGQDFRPKLRFSCSVATALQRFVPPWLQIVSVAKGDFVTYTLSHSFKNTTTERS